MYDETTQIVKSNPFITVSARWPAFAAMVHDMGIPIVTENQSRVARFKHSVLRVHFQKPAYAHKAQETRLQSFVMIADELSRLCTLIRYLHTGIPSPADHIRYARGNPPDDCRISSRNNPANSEPSLKFRVERRQHGELKSPSIKALLEPFRAAAFGLQIVRFLNIPPDLNEYAQDLKQAMSPRCVWFNAQAWHYLELVGEVKRQADALVVAGDTTRACRTYHHACMLWQVCPIFTLKKDMYTEEVASVVVQINIVLIKCAMIVNLIQVKHEVIEVTASKARLSLVEGIASHAITFLERDLPATLCATVSWVAVLHCFLFSRNEASTREALNAIQDLANKAAPSVQTYIKYDMAMIGEHFSKADVSMSSPAR